MTNEAIATARKTDRLISPTLIRKLRTSEVRLALQPDRCHGDPPAHLVVQRKNIPPDFPRGRLNGPEGRRAYTPPRRSENFGRPKLVFRRSLSNSSNGSHRQSEQPRAVLSPTLVRKLRTSETLACGWPITPSVLTPVHVQTPHTKHQSLLPHVAIPRTLSARVGRHRASSIPLPSARRNYLNRSRAEEHQTFRTS
jgi:hypothetical protein